MPDSSSTITNIQKLIKQLQKDALNQIQKAHSEPLGRIHQIMSNHGITPEIISLSYKKPRKPRTKKEVLEPRATLKLPVTQK